MKRGGSLRKDSLTKDGWGRSLKNKMSRLTKRSLDRLVDKRRRKEAKEFIKNETSD